MKTLIVEASLTRSLSFSLSLAQRLAVFSAARPLPLSLSLLRKLLSYYSDTFLEACIRQHRFGKLTYAPTTKTAQNNHNEWKAGVTQESCKIAGREEKQEKKEAVEPHETCRYVEGGSAGVLCEERAQCRRRQVVMFIDSLT